MVKAIDIKRKSKALFMKWRLHVIFDPFRKFMINLVYMSDLSKWRNTTKVNGYNDWYQGDWDYSRRVKLYNAVCEQEGVDKEAIDYFEFGVSAGASFRFWLEKNKNPGTSFYGFDTFEGLPESFGAFKKGDMSFEMEKLNITDPRASLHKGLFQDTLLPFLDNYKNGKRKVIHMDADIFTATLFVFSQMHRFLNDGDIIIFDEFAVPVHEFMALDIYTRAFYTKYEVIGAANNYLFLAIKIKKN